MHQLEKKYLLNSSVQRLIDDLQLDMQKVSEFYTVVKACKSIKYSKIGSKYYEISEIGIPSSYKESKKEISKRKYQNQKKRKVGSLIVKKRYLLQEAGESYSIERYGKKLQNIYILRVHFQSRKSGYSFNLPDLFKSFTKSDITRYEPYREKNLALFGDPDRYIYSIYSIFKDIELGRTTKLHGILFQDMKSADAVRVVLFKIFIDMKIDIDYMADDISDKRLKRFKKEIRDSRVILKLYREIFDKNIVKKVEKHLKLLSLTFKKERDLEFIKGELDNLKTLIEKERVDIISENIDQSISYERDKIRQFFKRRELSIIFKQYEILLKESSKTLTIPTAQNSIKNSLKEKIDKSYSKIIEICDKYEDCEDDKSIKKIKKAILKLDIIVKKFSIVIESDRDRAIRKNLKPIIKRVKELLKLKKRSLVVKSYLESTPNSEEILKIVNKESKISLSQKQDALKDAILKFKKEKNIFK